jgi:hypothetical protein
MKMTGAPIFGVLGVLGSLVWLSLNTVLSPDWGPPGSANYLGYQTVNRLWALAFALILCGYLGLVQRYPLRGVRGGRIGFGFIVTGLIMMMAGNIAEFWFLTELPFGQLNMRACAWIGVLLGMLGLLIGAAVLGLAGWRQHAMPASGGAGLALALPIFVFSFFTQRITESWLVLGGLGLLAGVMALIPQPVAQATPPQLQEAL